MACKQINHLRYLANILCKKSQRPKFNESQAISGHFGSPFPASDEWGELLNL